MSFKFMESIYEKAKAEKRTIAIPEVNNEYMIKAAVRAAEENLADIVLVGDAEDVKKTAAAAGVDASRIRVADVKDKEYVEMLLDKYENLPEKAMSRKFVAKRVDHPLYLATLMQAVGEADGTLAGVDTTTYEFVLAAKSIIGMKPNCPTASGLLIEEIEGFEGEQGNLIGMSDGAVCIQPTVEQHAGIAISSCETFEVLTGTEARCAFLSYSTDGSGGLSDPVKKVREAVAMAQKLRPDLKIDGEFQADAAVNLRVGQKKVTRESEVAGRANVLIFPDAAACNIASKLVQRLASNVQVYGPIYQGFRLPILDCSRSDTDVELYNSISLLSVMATAGMRRE